MLAIKVQTEKGERHVRLSAPELGVLVRRIGADGDRFLVVQRIPDLPDIFIQVWHETGAEYTLEHRDGAQDRHFAVSLDGPEPVVAAMTGWAGREEGWSDGMDWAPVDLGPAPDPVPPLELDSEERELVEGRVRTVLVNVRLSSPLPRSPRRVPPALRSAPTVLRHPQE